MKFASKLGNRLKKASAKQWAFFFLGGGLLVIIGGYINLYCTELCATWPASPIWFTNLVKDFYSNLALTLIGTAITVLVIDAANEHRAESLLKAQLLRELGHPTDNSVTMRALREITAYGWLTDGSLHEINLFGANLEKANLINADLGQAHLSFANLNEARLVKTNLEGADLTSASFIETVLTQVNLHKAKGFTLPNGKVMLNPFMAASTMRGTILPNGDRYDGCLNLDFDLLQARLEDIDVNNKEAMAMFYGVSLTQYERGQDWYHLHKEEIEKEIANQKSERNSMA